MEFEEYLKKYNAQKKIDKLAKLYKNKKIVLYGAGKFCTTVFQNYDLSKLNIVAIADKKFEFDCNSSFFNLKCITPKMLGEFDCDVILISNFDYKYFLTLLDDHVLYLSKNENITIRPLLKLTFKDLFLCSL